LLIYVFRKFFFQNDSSYEPRKDAQSAPPTYAQSLLAKIIANVRVNVENVIVKYIEDDLALSLNLKTFALSAANSSWENAFIGMQTGISSTVKLKAK